ncbi:hypothetical protein L0F63_005332 [Massospora cicadina]|nr:hypothetical protein L0F63_005332 [Massospora cicadina]
MPSGKGEPSNMQKSFHLIPIFCLLVVLGSPLDSDSLNALVRRKNGYNLVEPSTAPRAIPRELVWVSKASDNVEKPFDSENPSPDVEVEALNEEVGKDTEDVIVEYASSAPNTAHSSSPEFDLSLKPYKDTDDKIQGEVTTSPSSVIKGSDTLEKDEAIDDYGEDSDDAEEDEFTDDNSDEFDNESIDGE